MLLQCSIWDVYWIQGVILCACYFVSVPVSVLVPTFPQSILPPSTSVGDFLFLICLKNPTSKKTKVVYCIQAFLHLNAAFV